MKKIILSAIICLLMTSTSTNAITKKSEVKIKPIEKTYYDVNAFCKLIQMGNYEAVKTLIEKGEDVNKKSNGLTPLMFAARHNKSKIAKLLIDNGAKLKIKATNGARMTALEMAERSKAFDAVKVIKEAL
ncbi:MAG: ankyrin repeat protein [Polaribacter sp.]|jgi:ankyrin repeat protein